MSTRILCGYVKDPLCEYALGCHMEIWMRKYVILSLCDTLLLLWHRLLNLFAVIELGYFQFPYFINSAANDHLCLN